MDEAKIPEGRSWRELGLCYGSRNKNFFPERGKSTREAKALCAECSVRVNCLDYALRRNERFGIWGGLSTRERDKIRKLLPRNTAWMELSTRERDEILKRIKVSGATRSVLSS